MHGPCSLALSNWGKRTEGALRNNPKVTWKQVLGDEGPEEMPRGGRAKMGKAREETSFQSSFQKEMCLQMVKGWVDATP